VSHLRYVSRQLARSPGFALLAVLTLALGIGLNTAIFSIVSDLFFKRLPFAEPDRIVRIYGELAARDLRRLPFSIPRFWHYRDGQSAFSSMAADSSAAMTLTGLGDPVQLNASAVTANYFDLLGVRPIRGRLFRPEEESVSDVALVSESFWRGRLASDPNVVGRSVVLNGVPHNIVGVLPNMPVAWFGLDLEVWTAKPFQLAGYPRERLMRGAGYMRAIARLKSGINKEQTRANLASLDQSYHAQNPDKNDSPWTTTPVIAADDVTSNLRPAFATLVAAVSFVLLIACSNVANLLLVRFTGRRREVALRMSLGATRRNVIGLFVTESVVVSFLGGIVGALLAWFVVPRVPAMAANNLPLEPRLALSWSMLGFALAVSVVIGFATGLYPAWQSSSTQLTEALKEGARSLAGGPHQQRFRRILVAGEVALSITLLSAASVLIASFARLSHEDIGFQANHLWVGFGQL
jgi:predicted permease